MLALIVDATLRAKAGVQTTEIALRALATGVGGYLILAALEYGWHVVRVPAAMDAERDTDESALRAELTKLSAPPTEGVNRRKDRLRSWIEAAGSSTVPKSLLWLTDVVPAEHAVAHYVEPLQELAKQLGDGLKIRETTTTGGTVTDMQFKVRRWW